MGETTDIRNLWRGAGETADAHQLPDAADAVRFIRSYRRRQAFKKFASGALLLIMFFLFLGAVICGPAAPASRAGGGLIAVGYFALIFSNLNSLRRAVSQLSRSNREFAEYLKEGLRGRLYFYEKTQPALFAAIALGVFLYVYEMVRESTGLMLATYALLAAAFAVLWFVVRPRINAKRIARLRETIAQLENLAEQTEEF